MSILPYLLEELSQPTIYDQHFGLGRLDDDLYLRPCHLDFNNLRPHPYRRPIRLGTRPQSSSSHIKINQNNFKVNLDVQQFKPEEVAVKVENGFVVIDGKHEERSDEHGFISRQFTRRYKLLDNVDAASITYTLSSDRVMSVDAPRKNPEIGNKAIPIQIVQTSEPSIREPQNVEESGNSAEVKQ